MLDSSVIRLAIPIMLANASTPLVGLVDTAMLGFTSTSIYLAALAIGTMVLGTVGWSFGYLKMALTGIVAQARGREDMDTIEHYFYRSMRTAIVIGILLILCLPIINAITVAFFGSTDAVNDAASRYINIRLLAAPAMMANLVITGLLFGLAQPKRILIIFSVLNSCNIVLDLIFVKGFNMTIDGVAYASMIAEYLALVCGLILIRPFIKLSFKRVLSQPRVTSIPLGSMYMDLFLRTALLQAILLIMVRYSSQFGPDILAANGILIQIAVFTFYGLDGIAHSAEMLTGAAFGKGDEKTFLHHVRQCFGWGFIVALLTSVALLIGQQPTIALLTDIDSVVLTVNRYYLWLAILPLTSVACFIYDGIYVGTSATRIMRNMMALTFILYVLLLLIALPRWQNDGLWFAYNAIMIIRAITLAANIGHVRIQLKTTA